jgi:hypothetical protein
MFRSFTVKNFRCFRELTLTDLERVNLIGGKNNVGKTALLEALFLHVGANNPDLPLDINLLRGVAQLRLDTQELWQWLFFERRIDDPIEIVSRDEAGRRHILRIRFKKAVATPATSTTEAMGESPEQRLSPKRTVASLSTSPRAYELEITFESETPLTVSGHSISSAAHGFAIQEAGSPRSTLVRDPIDPFPPSIYLATDTHSPVEDADRFSKLVERGHEGELLAALQILEPRLRRLLILTSGGTPMVSGDVGSGPPIPLLFMGEGLARLLSLLLAITTAAGGTVMVDEIDNGLHHTTLVGIWRAVGEAARTSNTQIFATTHSWECIRAAEEAFSVGDETPDFRYMRLDRAENGDIRAATYVEDFLDTAIATGLEMR